MSEVDEVKKRIERRKKPLTNAHFNKLYKGMIRMMVLRIHISFYIANGIQKLKVKYLIIVI